MKFRSPYPGRQSLLDLMCGFRFPVIVSPSSLAYQAQKGGEREDGKMREKSPSLFSFLPPYPLPLSTPATQARLIEGSMKIALYFRIRVFAKCAVLASFGC